MIELPLEPYLFGLKVNVHLILEYLAFIVGFRYYVLIRNKTDDPISAQNRLSIIIGAVFGALVFSRLFAFLEDPIANFGKGVLELFNNKTIMGGLFGGLLGVELAKKLIGEGRSSGDMFTLPIILGILIGRVGCFLSGTREFTYGRETHSIFGMDLGDGLQRHPIVLYELVFLLVLFVCLRILRKKPDRFSSGTYFKIFMISYFSFRFLIEFLKPNTFLILGLSSIQYLCLLCLLYYQKTLRKAIAHVGEKVHLL